MLNHSLLIIIITVIISFLAFQNQRIMHRLIFLPPKIKQGEFDRFITYGFVHADGFHLLFNMMTLYFFGRHIELFYRQFFFDMGFALFYVGGLIFSILPSYFRHKNDMQWASLGASGAVSAVLFAFILFDPWSLIFVFFIPMPAIIFAILYVGYSIWANKNQNSNINHESHLWGALFGVITTIIIEPKVLGLFLSRLSSPSFF